MGYHNRQPTLLPPKSLFHPPFRLLSPSSWEFFWLFYNQTILITLNLLCLQLPILLPPPESLHFTPEPPLPFLQFHLSGKNLSRIPWIPSHPHSPNYPVLNFSIYTYKIILFDILTKTSIHHKHYYVKYFLCVFFTLFLFLASQWSFFSNFSQWRNA